MLQWLQAPDQIPQHRRACKLQRPGTGKWFLEHEAFVLWKQTPNSIYGLTEKVCGFIGDNVRLNTHAHLCCSGYW